MDFPFKSTKTFHQAFPVAYRQWRADTNCRVLHGYALSVHLEFGGFDLDARNWLVDFGGLKSLKGQLEDWFDHKLLVAQDDPHIDQLRALSISKVASITEVERTGCEGLADFIFEHLNDGWLFMNGYHGRVICTKVEVRETDANMAMRCLDKRDYYRFCAFNKHPQTHKPSVAANISWEANANSTGIRARRGLEYIHQGTIYYEDPGFRVGDKYYLYEVDAMDAVAESTK